MMDRVFALPYSSKDVHYVAGGVITRKDKALSLSWFIGKADVLAAVNARNAASERPYR